MSQKGLFERNVALYDTAKAMIDHERAKGSTREETKALMVHPSDEHELPGIIFRTLWPEE